MPKLVTRNPVLNQFLDFIEQTKPELTHFFEAGKTVGESLMDLAQEIGYVADFHTKKTAEVLNEMRPLIERYQK